MSVFRWFESITYEESQFLTIVLQRLEYRDNCTYTLSTTSSYLEIKLRNNKKEYSCTEFGEIQFTMPRSEKELSIRFIRKKSTIKTFGLVIRANDKRFDHTECSGIIEFIPKQNKISQKKKMKAKYINNAEDKFNNSFNRQCELDVFNQPVEEIKCVEETCEFSYNSDDDPSIKQDTSTYNNNNNIVWLFNMINFNDKSLSTRHQSIRNVIRINTVLGDKCGFYIKEVINASREYFLSTLKEYVKEIQNIKGQLIIFVMSHGNIDGFYTTDGFIYEHELRDSLRPILNNEELMKIIVLSYCQETNKAGKSFFESVLSSEDFDMSSGDVHTDIMLSSEEDDMSSGNVHEDITNAKNVKTESVEWFYPSNNTTSSLIVVYATLPGSLACVGRSGNIVLDELIDDMEESLKSPEDTNVEEVLRTFVNKFKDVTIVSKDKQKVTQQPWLQGHLDRGFLLQ